MAPKNKAKKANKVHNPGHERRDGKRPLVSSAVVARANPTTPIPALIASVTPPELKTVSLVNGAVRTVKKWCFESSTPIYCSPDEPWPSASLNKGAIIELTGQELSVSVADVKTSWSEVAYKIPDSQGGIQWATGWVNDAYLDDYKEEFPDTGVAIPNPTPDLKDAQQYMIWEGKVKYNLCGELCVAFIVDDDIDSVLAKWKKNSPGSYSAILAAGRDKTTSEADVKNMLGAILAEYDYGFDSDRLISLKNTLTYPVDPMRLLEVLKSRLATYCLISGVKINGGTGELIRKDDLLGKGHWVVLDKITRNGNRVEIYNPFPNRREQYSFTEFYNSCSTNSGIWVKRKRARPVSLPEDLPKLEVEVANPNPAYKAAQYINVEGSRKKNLCGEFCVAFILQEPINAVLERWKQVQPNLYAGHVVGDTGTGPHSLGTILKAYGYNTKGDFVEFASGMTDPFLKKCLVSPGRIAKMLRTHYFIAGVNIDGGTGRLKPGEDVRHWVVVNKLTPVGKNRGWVELYNPFQNRWEEYSYREFIYSAGGWSGLWVKRNIVPVYVEQVVESPQAEDKPGKDYPLRRWTESQLIDAIRRKSKSGKPIGKIAGELADPSGWKRQEIIRKFQTVQVGSARTWTEMTVLAEIRKRLQNGKPKNKIYAELTRLSGWKSRDVKKVYEGLLKAEKWTEAQLLAVLKEKLNKVKSPNKVVGDLVERSGWKRQEVLGSLKKLKAAAKWTEAQMGREIEKRLSIGARVNKIVDELAEKSGWKKQEVRGKVRKVLEAKKWSEVELLAAISEKLSAGVPAKKIAGELAPKSGWKTREVHSRLKKLKEAVKWTETQVRVEVEKLLEIGKPVNKIATELSEMSGWKKWEVSRILKTARKAGRELDKKLRLTIKAEPVRVVDPSTIIHASRTRAEFVEWQDSLLSQPNSKLYRVRKWGDPIMVKYGMDVNQVGCTNFQAVGLYNNGNREFGAISNYIRLPYEDVLRLKAMQIEDEYVAKSRHKDWRKQKMNWLCKARGTIYFYYHHASQGDWQTLSYMEWGTLALGGNLVQVEGTEVVHAKLRNGVDGDVEVARLKGFRPCDWTRPLDDLLAEGVVHRCFCAYKSNHFGDSPKGIVYSPFYSPQEWEFTGKTYPTALYIPVEWLEPKTS